MNIFGESLHATKKRCLHSISIILLKLKMLFFAAFSLHVIHNHKSVKLSRATKLVTWGLKLSGGSKPVADFMLYYPV